MTYSQKLRDPRWQRKRLHILERDKWTCCSCKSTTKNLQVHHLIYSKCDPWDYEDHCLQTLCEDCHHKRQAIADLVANNLKLALRNVPTDEMGLMAGNLINVANSNDSFRAYAASTMNQAFDCSAEEDAPLHFGLLSDLVMALFFCNIHKTPSAARTAEQLIGMAAEKLEAIK